MISIKAYMQSNGEGERLPTLLRVVHALLRAIAKDIIEYDSGQTTRFRRGIEDIETSFDESQSKSQMLLLAGSAVKALDDYNQSVLAHFNSRQSEFAELIKMLTATLPAIGTVGAENINRLQGIERMVNSVADTCDITVIKVRLEDCLEQIGKEVARQRAEVEKTTRMLTAEIQKHQVDAAELRRVDVLTGLPSRDEAESAITRICASDRASYVAVLMVDHLQLYNVRFGRTAGDSILRHFGENMRQLLPRQDGLFRWGGPTFIATIDRSLDIDDVRAEITRFLEKVPSISLESDTRTAVVAVKSRWTVFPSSPPAQALIKKIDVFTSTHMGPA
jgi:diguanylate cyclase (GGDEF)-like protein